jgi:hypothetical protein
MEATNDFKTNVLLSHQHIIYVDYFEFFNVNLPSAGTYTLDIYDLTTQSFLSGGTFDLTVS